MGINRNIVECKLYSGTTIFRIGARINRNIVECKLCCFSLHKPFIHELIETLWNVNSYKLLFSLKQFLELIETLWNVNIIHINRSNTGFSN